MLFDFGRDMLEARCLGGGAFKSSDMLLQVCDLLFELFYPAMSWPVGLQCRAERTSHGPRLSAHLARLGRSEGTHSLLCSSQFEHTGSRKSHLIWGLSSG